MVKEIWGVLYIDPKPKMELVDECGKNAPLAVTENLFGVAREIGEDENVAALD